MFGLSADTLEKILGCLAQYPEIHWVKIYGSRATGQFRRGSDIDLAFSAAKDCSASLAAALDALSTPYLFDVTYYEGLRHEGLKDHIDRVGKIIYPDL